MSDKIELMMLCGVLQSNFSCLSQSESRTQACHVRMGYLGWDTAVFAFGKGAFKAIQQTQHVICIWDGFVQMSEIPDRTLHELYYSIHVSERAGMDN